MTDENETSVVTLDPYQCIAKRNRKYASECTEVHLSKRGGEKISENFNHFTNLEVVWLNGNRLSRIENLDTNFRIKEVYVEDNRLVSLQALRPFKFLRVLMASNNQIRNLEKQLALLTRFNFLNKLDLFGNPVAEEPDYRLRVIYNVKQVEYLDRMAVKGPERLKADEVVPNLDKVSPLSPEAVTKRKPAASLLERKCFMEARQLRERRLRGEFEITLEKTGAVPRFGLHVKSDGHALRVDRVDDGGVVERYNRAAVPDRAVLQNDLIVEVNGAGRGDLAAMQRAIAESSALRLIIQREDETQAGNVGLVRDLSGAEVENADLRRHHHLTRPSAWERSEMRQLIEKCAQKTELNREDVTLLVQILKTEGLKEVGRCLVASTRLPNPPRAVGRKSSKGSLRLNTKGSLVGSKAGEAAAAASEAASRPGSTKSGRSGRSRKSGAAVDAGDTTAGHPLEKILVNAEETMPIADVIDWLLGLGWPYHEAEALEEHIAGHYDEAQRLTPPPLDAKSREWKGWAAVHAAARAEGVHTRRQALPGLADEDGGKGARKTRGDVFKTSLHREFDEETGKFRLVMPKESRLTAIGG